MCITVEHINPTHIIFFINGDIEILMSENIKGHFSHICFLSGCEDTRICQFSRFNGGRLGYLDL